ncbi:ribosome biogenesis GTPase Der [Rhodospirillum rubrum]|uniref:GTPase Der n=1 Tax=Rhodospirillum rubrum (strain ATCC 11170 / ATH 1.1.1 / DSM 467 / LMG 4362 / NCIMB 8255 / S1) TaxID=269796 RepID=Q2RPR6_RHORT|nr:ribosome biogenesis GTPase Der [Rhodospirillum rubrum]ABC23879.1 Small GTP-binding protein domain [Rhodospirillum rubrum ATCC 11170]AEO49623.1 GTP-binding protein EngA [Rhodospirillum rubrum F11]MBK5955555.1 ribosome biogenesis GTPase Der [Rhodospirillum rubrum]QXG79825.1 ribosome biogenesis GTPase Der [Rhodospirillum rubrum]HAQ00832.1 ribosome biogenesis GTPase Der [Rhodospirillum rubrum]
MFTVAIIGRPNVGKSTLFNRLCGRRLAIVHDMPGVTRDRREGKASLADLVFRVVDTAGLEEAGPEVLEGRMRQQTDRALSEAHVALMLIDSRAGVTPLDAHFAEILRKAPIPVILVANKCEGGAGKPGFYESYSMGLGDPVPLSAEHGEGLSLLYEALMPIYDAHMAQEAKDEADAVRAAFLETEAASAAKPYIDFASLEPDEVPEDDDSDPSQDPEDDFSVEAFDPRGERPIQMAIIGRPNTGKSTLINRLIGDDRLVTGPEAGVTRDAIEVDWEWGGRRFRLVDTAGLRRKARVENSLEKLMVADTLNAIRLAEVCVLMLDANMVMDRQDLTIARLVIDEGRALVIAVNKWDACADRKAALQRLADRLETSLAQVRGVPFVTLSALEGHGLNRLMDAALEAHAKWNRRVPTSRFNRWLKGMIDRHPLPMGKHGRRLRIRYGTQAKIRPPTFALFMTRPDDLPESYVRYLNSGLREDFDMAGTPIRLLFRATKNPYADK